MAASGIRITGDKALLRKFKKLSSTVQRRVVRRPLTAALTPINKAAKREAPKDTKALSKSIGKRVKVYRGGVFGAVGPRTDERYTVTDDRGRRRVPSRYAHLVEFGTRNRAPNAFLRRAFDENKSRALRIQSEGIRKNIEKEATKR
jgi:HK97 gp10 family phage protein